MAEGMVGLADRLERIRNRHFDCYLDLARTSREEGGDEGGWLPVLDAELANIRSAVEWGLETSRRETAAFATALLWYWHSRRLYNEGRDTLDRVLRDGDLQPLERADALLGAGSLAAAQGDSEAARGHYEQAHRIATGVEDRARQAQASRGLGWSLFKLLRISDAVEAFSEARQLSANLNLAERADVLRGLGWARGYSEGHEISLVLHREARLLLEDAGDPALTDHYLVETNLLARCGLVEEALALADKSVKFARDAGRPMSLAYAAKSNAAEASGDRDLLRQVIEEGVAVAREEEVPVVEAKLLERLARDAISDGEMDLARETLDRALKVLDDTETLDVTAGGFRADLLVLRSRLADDDGEFDLALELYRQAIATYSRSSAHSHAESLVALGRMHVEHGDAAAAQAVERQASALLDRIDAEIGTLVRIDFAVLADELEAALRLATEALDVALAQMPRDVPGLLVRKATVLAELGRLDDAAAAAEELAATGLGGTTLFLERARIRVAAGDGDLARADLLRLASTAHAGWGGLQLQLATTLTRLALLEGRRGTAIALWEAVQRYRATTKRRTPPLAHQFEKPLAGLPVPGLGGGPSREALEALRRLVMEEFESLSASGAPSAS